MAVDSSSVHARIKRDRASIVLLVVAAALVVFEGLLAAGLPFGSAAWGGAHRGSLPPSLRVASAISAILWLWLAGVIAGRLLGPTARRRILLAVAIYSLVGILLNLASKSALERVIWAPVSAVGAVSAWFAWRAAGGRLRRRNV